MSFYFKYIPKTDYTFKIFKGMNPSYLTGQHSADEPGKSKQDDIYYDVQDITRRFALEQIIPARQGLFYDYLIEENETAQEIASRYYGDAKLDWIIYLANKIHDPYYQWPMDSYTFELYIKKKYGSLAEAQGNIHSYWQIITKQRTLDTGNVIKQRMIQVDLTTYNSLAPADRLSYSDYDWELKENDDRRTITIIDADFVPDIIRRVQKLYR
jgi:hypothetical protein